MLSPEEKEKIKEAILRKAEELDDRITEYRELTKPIPPSDAIGRVSRMDAINNKSVNEAALRQAEKQRQGLDRALQRLDDDRFGLCTRCGEPIPTGRIMLMPGALTCVRCAG
ncbi:MAG: TraR/DksA C4-type zinc finger protein [Flavobacteriales bacterium]|nr:TraR/DksA C4-type zinc finger protein [Flavobacteriales bacterium]